MMDYLTPVILGLVEGITEFLPISSTGHLILVSNWLSLEGDSENVFNVVIQLGAILSVLVYFRNKLLFTFNDSKSIAKEIWVRTLIGVIPALASGYLLGDIIENKLFNTLTVSITLLIGGLVLVVLESINKRSAVNSIEQLSYKQVFIIGLFQCLALIPGTSRSAATIIGAMAIGTSRNAAAEFSFFLAIPTMLAASSYSLMKSGTSLTIDQWIQLLIGFVTALLTALVVISSLMTYIQNRSFVLGCLAITALF